MFFQKLKIQTEATWFLSILKQCASEKLKFWLGDLQIKCDWKHVFPDLINSKVEQLHFSEKIHQFFETFLIPDWSHLHFEGSGKSIFSDALKSRLEQVDFERNWAQLHVKSDEIPTGTRGFGKIVASSFL